MKSVISSGPQSVGFTELLAGEDPTAGVIKTADAGSAEVLSASGQVKSGAGSVVGFFVASGTSVTVKIWDSLSATGTVILDTTAAITPAGYYPCPAKFTTGCYVTLGGTTPSVTVIYN